MTSAQEARVPAIVMLVCMAVGGGGCVSNGAETTAAGEAGMAGFADRGATPRVRTIATGLNVPWDLAFLPDGSALVTERPGRIRVLDREGRLRRAPVARVAIRPDAFTAGLLGIAVDPQFERTRFVFVYRSVMRANQVVRYRFMAGRLIEPVILVDGIPGNDDHVGGRIRFGPDRALYVTTGYGRDEEAAQDPRGLAGKVLRLEPSAYRGPGGANPRIIARGLRNPQGMTWNPQDGTLLVTDHGYTSDDEVNLVEPGANFGWPDVRADERRDGYTPPLVLWRETVAPSGAAFVTSPGSAWRGSLLVATLKGRALRRLVLRERRVVRDQVLYEGAYGRLRAVVEGPDGRVYVTTSNRDSLGSPRRGDDRILQISPPQ